MSIALYCTVLYDIHSGIQETSAPMETNVHVTMYSHMIPCFSQGDITISQLQNEFLYRSVLECTVLYSILFIVPLRSGYVGTSC
jgi:hypothetical protein